jgi:hypothetical protein
MRRTTFIRRQNNRAKPYMRSSLLFSREKAITLGNELFILLLSKSIVNAWSTSPERWWRYVIKTLATIFGVVFLIIGILGFFSGDSHMLFGVFNVNAMHNIIHLLTGALALYAGMSGMPATMMYFRVFGVVYAIVAILGFVYQDNDILGFISSNMADTWLHVVVALVALYAGFMGKADETPMA